MAHDPPVSVRNGLAILSSKIELPLSDTKTVEEAAITLREAKSTSIALCCSPRCGNISGAKSGELALRKLGGG
jgi:hypothetical protein